MFVRGWMPVWTADGMAQGEVYGTNTSFSRAVNICNRCEDMDQRDPLKSVPCGFLCCKCGDAHMHAAGCKCHFQLRNAARDAVRPQLTKESLQKLGITAPHHSFTDVPHFNVAPAQVRKSQCMHCTRAARNILQLPQSGTLRHRVTPRRMKCAEQHRVSTGLQELGHQVTSTPPSNRTKCCSRAQRSTRIMMRRSLSRDHTKKNASSLSQQLV